MEPVGPTEVNSATAWLDAGSPTAVPAVHLDLDALDGRRCVGTVDRHRG